MRSGGSLTANLPALRLPLSRIESIKRVLLDVLHLRLGVGVHLDAGILLGEAHVASKLVRTILAHVVRREQGNSDDGGHR